MKRSAVLQYTARRWLAPYGKITNLKGSTASGTRGRVKEAEQYFSGWRAVSRRLTVSRRPTGLCSAFGAIAPLAPRPGNPLCMRSRTKDRQFKAPCRQRWRQVAATKRQFILHADFPDSNRYLADARSSDPRRVAGVLDHTEGRLNADIRQRPLARTGLRAPPGLPSWRLVLWKVGAGMAKRDENVAFERSGACAGCSMSSRGRLSAACRFRVRRWSPA